MPNYHAHILWDWMDHSTGKSWKLNAQDMSELQDMVAETLQMERGISKSETNLEHLERNDYIIHKQENKKRMLEDEKAKTLLTKRQVYLDEGCCMVVAFGKEYWTSWRTNCKAYCKRPNSCC